MTHSITCAHHAHLQTPEREFLLRVSYFELYNEVINDLLNPVSGANLTIREDKKVSCIVVVAAVVVVTPQSLIIAADAGTWRNNTPERSVC
jgi:centromeric protein E